MLFFLKLVDEFFPQIMAFTGDKKLVYLYSLQLLKLTETNEIDRFRGIYS